MQIHFERPHACRLYTALGQMLWLDSATGNAATDEEKLEALAIFKENLEKEIGIDRINQMQDEVYCSLNNPMEF